MGTPGGAYVATFGCETGKERSGTPTLSFAAVTVDKVVEGRRPADATFPITVSCNQAARRRRVERVHRGGGNFLLDTSFSFAATGGRYLVALHAAVLLVSEVDDAGAVSATIDLSDCGDGRTTNKAEAAARRRLPDRRADRLHPDDHQRLRGAAGHPARRRRPAAARLHRLTVPRHQVPS